MIQGAITAESRPFGDENEDDDDDDDDRQKALKSKFVGED